MLIVVVGMKEGGKTTRNGQGVYYDYFYSTKTIIKGRWEYDTHQTGDVYKFKDLFDDESLTKNIKKQLTVSKQKVLQLVKVLVVNFIQF